jgi:hydrogenase maturation protein HypF
MYRIRVKGVVQGVGFRPFIYRLATSMNLRGYVKNTGDGSVEIVIDRNPEKFIERMKNEKPSISQIDYVKVDKIEEKPLSTFKIEKSGGKSDELSLPPPDVAICESCLKELFDVKDRRYRYSFISCTDCGPRFSVAERLPYDRENTTFMEFPMCGDCEKEYSNVEDRRYYAQSIACPLCGPDYTLFNIDREKIESGYRAIKIAAKLIDEGNIVAVKGIGGFHIACRTDDEIVKKLRGILRRVQQPFAIMVRDIEYLKKIAVISEKEGQEMASYIRPITVVKKRDRNSFFEVAPHLDTIGAMLPYSPLHFLLFENLRADSLVMTSANLPGEPMFIDDGVFELPVEYVLSHNLKINNRVDDSVIKFVNGRKMIIRRSRGLVPVSTKLESPITCVSLGAELYSSVCILKDSRVVQSQYIGNTSNFRTFNEFFRKTIDFFTSFFRIEKIDAIFCDYHPLYNTSIFAEKFAKEKDTRLLRVQHHFAHGMSVMAEKELNRAVSISVDGVGYGFDGSTWGGEVLLIDFENMRFERIGRLEEFLLPGGDLAGKYPLRVLFSLIYDFTRDYDLLRGYDKYLRENESFELLSSQIERNISTFPSTSAGRMLDAISAMLEVCFERTYEGEPAMKLEAVASAAKVRDGIKPRIQTFREDNRFPPYVEDGLKIRNGTIKVLKTKELVVNLLEEYLNGVPKEEIAWKFINYLGKGLAEIAGSFAEKENLPVVLSGGVAYNTIFTSAVEKELGDKNIKLFTNEITASGDNGISFGQIYLAKYIQE